jgi:hypothetical protein
VYIDVQPKSLIADRAIDNEFFVHMCLRPNGPQAKRNSKEVIRFATEIGKPYIYEL